MLIFFFFKFENKMYYAISHRNIENTKNPSGHRQPKLECSYFLLAHSFRMHGQKVVYLYWKSSFMFVELLYDSKIVLNKLLTKLSLQLNKIKNRKC